MASPAGKITVDDFKRWGILFLQVVIAGAIDITAQTVIPELQALGGPINSAIALGLTLVLDLARRYLTDTRKVPPTEAESLVVKEGFITSLFKKLGMKK